MLNFCLQGLQISDFFLKHKFYLCEAMKHLILIRHAESAEKVTGQTDKDRQLTTSGMRQSAAVGQFLKNQSVPVDIILSSPALRTATTAQVISEQLNSGNDIVINDELYQASVGTLINMLRDGDQYHNITIVGHNPTLTYFAEFITDSQIEDLRPATALVMKLDIGNWKDLNKGSAILLDRFEA
jgi:phosphohistidine phosphatase